MPIVSSAKVVGHEQVDGRRYVREVHIDQDGIEYAREYLSDAGADYDAIMAARAAQISEYLAEAEIEQVLNG